MIKIGNLDYKPKSSHPGFFIGLNSSISSSPDLKHKQICFPKNQYLETSFPGV